MTTTTYMLLAAALVCIGFAGILLPALPGTPLIFAGLLLAAWAEGFDKVGWLPLTLLGVLTAVAWAVDLMAAALGARRAGASTLALVGAVIGTVVGIFMGFLGLLFAPLVGATVGEYIARQDSWRAAQVGFSTWIGLLLGAVAKVAIACTMLGVFVAAYWID